MTPFPSTTAQKQHVCANDLSFVLMAAIIHILLRESPREGAGRAAAALSKVDFLIYHLLKRLKCTNWKYSDSKAKALLRCDAMREPAELFHRARASLGSFHPYYWPRVGDYRSIDYEIATWKVDFGPGYVHFGIFSNYLALKRPER